MKLKNEICSPVDYLPLQNPMITSGYGWRMLAGQKNFHDGIDFANPLHNCKDRLKPIGTEIYAVAAGNICYDYDKYDDRFRMDIAGHKQDSAGNMVIIKTAINGIMYYVRYLHLIENFVKENEFVSAGQLIGRYADVGFSYGAHLHLDIYSADWGQKLDPTPILFDI